MAQAVAILHRFGRAIAVIAALIAVLIGLGIAFRVLHANQTNAIVSFVTDLGRFFVGPFDGMFKPKNPDAEIAVNWGIALVFYLAVGQLIERLLRRVAAEP